MATKKKSKKPPTAIIKSPPWQLFNTVVDRLAEIGEVILGECAAQQNAAPASGKFNLTINFGAAPLRNKSEEDKFAVLVQFALTATDPTPETVAAPFLSIRAAFLVEYTLHSMEGITPEHLSVFAKRNGVFNAWPYWREFVQSTLARMGIPSISIPVFRQGMTSLQGTIELEQPGRQELEKAESEVSQKGQRHSSRI